MSRSSDCRDEKWHLKVASCYVYFEGTIFVAVNAAMKSGLKDLPRSLNGTACDCSSECRDEKRTERPETCT